MGREERRVWSWSPKYQIRKDKNNGPDLQLGIICNISARIRAGSGMYWHRNERLEARNILSAPFITHPPLETNEIRQRMENKVSRITDYCREI